jgi:hypothetical protein
LNSLSQLAHQLRQSFPELAHVRSEQDLHNLHAQLQAQNPARAQALAQADQVVRQRQTALAHLTRTRQAHEAQAQTAVAQQRAAFRAQQDSDFNRRAEKLVPNWEQARPAVQQAAMKTLENAGLTQQQISHLWHGNDSVDVHSAVAQELLLKASMWDSAQAKAKQIRQSNLPTVIKPGVGNVSRENKGVARVNDLKARLKGAKGNEAIRLGTELTRTKRALNGA